MNHLLKRTTMLLLSVLLAAAPRAVAQQALKAGSCIGTVETRRQAPAHAMTADDAMMRSRTASATQHLSMAQAGHYPLPPAKTISDQIREATGGVTIVGNVLFSDPPAGQASGSARLGIYEFGIDNSGWNQLQKNVAACTSAVMIDDVYYNFYVETGVILTRYYVKTYNTDTWQETGSKTLTNAKLPRALTTDGTTVYGCFHNGLSGDAAGFEYGILDLSTFNHTKICALPRNWNACAWGNDGFIYAIDMAGDLYKVEPASGEMTLVGATGKVPKYISGAAIDKKSGRMFWTLSPEDLKGYLYEVNLTTGVASLLHQFQYNDEIGGLYIPFLAMDNAPAAVAGLEASFENGSLSGQIKFTCPTTLFDGTAASGPLTYSILANGTQIATGSCAFGQQMSVDVTMTKADNYTFEVTVANNNGSSPKSKTALFVGKDKPQTPVVSLTYSDGKMHVSWNKITESVNGGYMDASKMKYTVYRYPGMTAVARSITDNSFEEEIAIPDTYTLYYYTVMASCDGTYSSAGTSNTIGLGSMKMPYSVTFDYIDDMDNLTVIDGNNDGKVWVYDATYKCARMMYSLTTDNNDWLVTAPLHLEAGKAYRFTTDFRNYDAAKYPEKAEVKMGRAPTAEAMTTTLVETTTFTGKEWTTVDSYIIPAETGSYYIGLHSISPKNSSMYLYADNISVAEVEGGVPGGVTNLVADADASGGMSAVVSGNAPATTLNGQPLASISRLEIKRDGSPVKTIDAITPGASFSFTDTGITETGNHTWSLTCFNDKGAGKTESVTAYIGFDVPASVTNVEMTETALGKVHISWTAPTLDASGKPLGNIPVTYTIAKGSTIYAQGLTETSFDYQVLTSGQEFFQPLIYARNATGLSAGVYAPFTAVGVPFKLPYLESFPGGDAPSYLLGIYRVAGGSPDWGLCYDGYMGIDSPDHDNGWMSCKFAAIDDASMMFTGKIDLTTASNPAFSFYTYNVNNGTNDNLNEVDVMVREVGVQDWTSVKHGTVHELCNGDTSVWRQVKVSLLPYKGKVIQIGVQGRCKGYAWFMVDRMYLADDLTNNLAINTISAPAVAKPYTDFTISTKVENNGANTVTDYTVEFYRGDADQPFKTVKGTSVAAGSSRTFTAVAQLGFTDEDAEARFRTVVRYAADENNDDNQSEIVKVKRIYSEKDAPVSLSGQENEAGVVALAWNAPDLSNTGGDVTDNLEGYTSWANTGAGNWMFVDKDLHPRGGFQNLDIPDNPQRSYGSFFVFEQGGDFNASFAAHSGNKFFASIFNIDASKVDDWLISPVLDGSAQTIRFWAKSYSASYPEVMEVLYSTTDANPDNFVSALKVNEVAAEWTEYTVALPAGARFFAVRNNGADKFMLMIDDFSFKAGNDIITGYNVYRDGVKITTSPVADTRFSDSGVAVGNHRYDVTALYINGEETAPATCSVAVTSVAQLQAGVSVGAGSGCIDISGAEGMKVAIVNMQGIEVYRSIPAADLHISIAPGVYMVRVGNGLVKVIVR